MLKFFHQFVNRRNGKPRLPELAENIARQCVNAVWQRVAGRIASMGTAQARGYVRGRASGLLRHHVDHAIRHDHAAAATSRDRLVQLAIDAVIRLVLRIPTPVAATVRRAA